jgi:hypothetical protein
VLEVLKNHDGTYEVFWNAKRVRTRVTECWLNSELCTGYGFCGSEYEDIFRQLTETGKAKVDLSG